MATEQPCAGLGSWHPWLPCKAFDPRESLNLGQHIRTNVNGVFTISTPGNANDFVSVTPLSGNGFCVDVILGSWTKSFVGVIPGNDPAFDESRFDWIPHHHNPQNYHLFFLSCPNSIAGAYFFPPARNLSPTYVTAQSLGPFPHVGHAPWRPIPSRVFDTTLLQGQIVPPPVRAPYPHVFFVFAPTRWTPEKTPRIHSRHGFQNVLQTFLPPLESLPNHSFAGDPHRRRQLYAPTVGFLGST